MNLLESIQKFYKDIENLSKLQSKLELQYQMLKLLEKTYKMYKSEAHDIIQNIIRLTFYKNNINYEKYNLLLECLEVTKLYPQSTDQLVLNGNILMSKFKITGKQIKTVKDLLLDAIFKNEAQNNLESLETEIKKII